MEIVIERTKLYEEVWAEPLTKLCKKYGLSDNGLRKICKAMNIPLPQAGHWAKIAAGHCIGRIPLPEHAERTTFSSHPALEDKSPELAEDQVWCREHVVFERQPENKIIVAMNPRRWHPAVIDLKERHREAAKKYEGYRKLAPEWAKRGSQSWPRPAWEQEWDWNMFVARGQILIDSHKAIPVKVSPLTWHRAMAILNALAFAAEKRGFSVGVNNKKGRIQLEGYGATIDVRLAERIEERWKSADKSTKGRSEGEKIKVPSGRLRLQVEGWRASVTEFADAEDAPLETKLNAAFVKVYRAVVRDRDQSRHLERCRKESEEAEQRRQEAARLRLEEVRRLEEERERRVALAKEAADWQKATLIRDYVAHVMAVATQPMTPLLMDWKNWALQVASDVDPTKYRCTRELP